MSPLSGWAVFLLRHKYVSAGESSVCPVLCLLSSPVPLILTSTTDTAGWASSLGPPVFTRSFLGERAGFYHLVFFRGVTVAAAVDKRQKQQQNHGPWRKVSSYVSLYVSLLAPRVTASTLLAVCHPFSSC